MRKRRIVFIHVPKTGGTAFLQAIGAGKSRMHIPWQVFWQANRFRFDAYLKVAVVRNPYDRLVSVYSYLKGGGSRATDGELAADLDKHAPDFETFVMNYLDPSRLAMHNLFRPQAFYICDVFGKVMVDRLCHFESLDEDMRPIFTSLGLPGVPLPSVNRSERSGVWSDYYSPELALRVQHLYGWDFDALGYSREITQ